MQVQIRYDRLVADIDRVLVYDNVPPAERERAIIGIGEQWA